MKIKLFNAGHTPGSAQVLVEADGKKILFTGDYNMEDSKLLTGATMDYGDLDAVVTESTYASEDHTPRPSLRKILLRLQPTWLSGEERFWCPHSAWAARRRLLAS